MAVVVLHVLILPTINLILHGKWLSFVRSLERGSFDGFLADQLLASVANTQPRRRSVGPKSFPIVESRAGDMPGQSVERLKREQVTAACQSCRQKKIKCDALRPCTPCVKRELSCHNETQDGETHSRAFKRKYDELVHSHSTYVDLFDALKGQSERDAVAIVNWIQRGHSPEAVLKLTRAGNVLSTISDPVNFRLAAFLINLAHSTGSLRDICELAMSASDPSVQIKLPDAHEYAELRNRIVYLSQLKSWLETSSRSINRAPTHLLEDPSRSLDRSAGPSEGPESRHLYNYNAIHGDVPPLQVTAAPWTRITTSDEVISHLVSLYFAWINPTWRFVEEDLFLRGMRSRNADSIFCSSFLVNSICAIASLHSEDDGAYPPGSRDRITRGQHFHDEALRLWILEENRPTMTNVQALCVISLESNYRALDRLGLTLIPIAYRLSNEMLHNSNEERRAVDAIPKADYVRARLATYWTAKCTHVIMRIAFMSDERADPQISTVPKIEDVFEDKVEYWIGYPLTKAYLTHRPTLYLLERCRLAEIFEEMHNLIFTDGGLRGKSIRDFANAVDHLSSKMQHWYHDLPSELRYKWPVSIAVWELHASYLSCLQTLFVVARTRFQDGQDTGEGNLSSVALGDEEEAFRSQQAQEKLSNAISLARRAAQILRDFRQYYGLKISPAWLLQLQAVTAGVLLLDPELAEPVEIISPMTRAQDGIIEDSHTAFDEVFRCLLGSSVQCMSARGIARMMHHTALEKKIVLSASTRSILQIMSSTAWRPSDLALVDSIYPNSAITKGHEDRERMTELLSKWENLEV